MLPDGCSEQTFMREAIHLAREHAAAGHGGPFGAVIVQDREIIARGWNQVTSTNDPTAHAEVIAIREACRRLGRFKLNDCEIYASCEPCPMCLAAIYWARLRRLYFAGGRQDAADAGFDDEFLYSELLRPSERRQLPTRQLLRNDALVAFDEWLMKSDRISY